MKLNLQHPDDRDNTKEMTALMGMNILPNEILLKILSYLPVSDLLGAASRVCSRWEQLCLEVCVWNQACGGLCYHGKNDWPQPTVAPKPTIVVHERDDVGRVLGEVWLRRGCFALKGLIMQMCRLGDARRLLDMAVQAFPNIQHLSLQECTPLSEHDYFLLAGLSQLQALNLSHCKGVTGNAVRAIVSRCSQIKKLRLDWTDGLTDDDIAFIVEHVGHQLIVLTIGGNLLTDEGFKTVSKCKSLQELAFAPCPNIKDSCLMECLLPLSKLKTLELSDPSTLTKNGLLDYFILSTYLENVTAIKLSWCNAVNDECMHIIGNRCRTLKRLALVHCPNISDDGMAHVIGCCNRIESLSLIWNDSLSGRSFLPRVIHNLPNLRHVDLGYCGRIPHDQVEELVTLRSGITVVRPEVWCRPLCNLHTCRAAWDNLVH